MATGGVPRKLGKHQLRWKVGDKEMYAILSGLWKWRVYIGTTEVVVITDHSALTHWINENVETQSGPTGRKARWHELLSLFNLHIQYLPGEKNVVADALSRIKYPREDVEAEEKEFQLLSKSSMGSWNGHLN